MSDIVDRLRERHDPMVPISYGEALRAEAADKIVRLEAALVQIGILNASGGHFDIEIDRAIREAAEQAGEQ